MKKHIYKNLKRIAAAFFLLLAAAKLHAQEAVEAVTEAVAEAAKVDTGNTAWIIVATVLVLMMTIPGLALFYGGLVRQKNLLSIIMQCFVLVGVITILWVAFGYSWVFGSGFMESGSPLGFFIGGFDKAFLRGVTVGTLLQGANIPEALFALFQCMFAIITPALIIGAFAERVKFGGYLLFIVLWSIVVYNPLAHWVWGGGWLGELGAIDFAGGTVVHINAGISALVMAIMLGKRKGYRYGRPTAPHNVAFVFIGAAFLWLGWFGFNAGSGLAADGLAANAFLVTHLSTAAAAVTWMAIDWIRNGKPTTVGACTGAVAGLVAITPAAGTVDVLGAFVIGAASSAVCFFMVAVVKTRLKYDDSLDAFGVHGVGGIIGSILTGVFATQLITGDGGQQGALYGDWHQLWVQTVATVATIAYSAVLTIILFYIVDKLVGIRVSARVEEEGLDVYEHGEASYG
ncbi:MAG: ammonium transporter [Prevotellaceae bacterium]|jgi:Amt family ammonium transporter|nr:ammonium transporter [Prevotellaceae bacterium]